MTDDIFLPEELSSSGLFTATIGENPFPSDDLRHETWLILVRRGAEQDAQLWSDYLQHAVGAGAAERLSLLLEVLVSHYDILVQPIVGTVSGYEYVRHHERAVATAAEGLLSVARFWLPYKVRWDSVGELLRALELRLTQRRAYWTTEMLKLVRQAEETNASDPRTALDARVGEAGDANVTPDSGPLEVTAPQLRPTEALSTSSPPAKQPVSTKRHDAMIGGPQLRTWLTTAMEREQMTVNRLHVLTDLDRKTINAIRGGKRVSRRHLQKLSKGLNVPESDIPTD